MEIKIKIIAIVAKEGECVSNWTLKTEDLYSTAAALREGATPWFLCEVSAHKHTLYYFVCSLRDNHIIKRNANKRDYSTTINSVAVSRENNTHSQSLNRLILEAIAEYVK